MKNLKNYYKKKMLTNKLSNSVEHQNIAKKIINRTIYKRESL